MNYSFLLLAKFGSNRWVNLPEPIAKDGTERFNSVSGKMYLIRMENILTDMWAIW